MATAAASRCRTRGCRSCCPGRRPGPSNAAPVTTPFSGQPEERRADPRADRAGGEDRGQPSRRGDPSSGKDRAIDAVEHGFEQRQGCDRVATVAAALAAAGHDDIDAGVHRLVGLVDGADLGGDGDAGRPQRGDEGPVLAVAQRHERRPELDDDIEQIRAILRQPCQHPDAVRRAGRGRRPPPRRAPHRVTRRRSRSCRVRRRGTRQLRTIRSPRRSSVRRRSGPSSPNRSVSHVAITGGSLSRTCDRAGGRREGAGRRAAHRCARRSPPAARPLRSRGPSTRRAVRRPSGHCQSVPQRHIAASTSQNARPLSVRRYSWRTGWSW